MEPANKMSTFAGSMVSLTWHFPVRKLWKANFRPSQVGKIWPLPPERLIGWTIIMIVVIVAGCLTFSCVELDLRKATNIGNPNISQGTKHRFLCSPKSSDVGDPHSWLVCCSTVSISPWMLTSWAVWFLSLELVSGQLRWALVSESLPSWAGSAISFWWTQVFESRDITSMEKIFTENCGKFSYRQYLNF